MADPLTIGLGLGSLLGGGAAFLSSKKGSSAAPVAPAVDPASNTPPADPSTPASVPGSKPAKKSQQASFLSGASALQNAGGFGGSANSSGGKSLLGQ